MAMHRKREEGRRTEPRQVALALVLGLLAALSATLTLDVYELDAAVQEQMAAQGGLLAGALNFVYVFVWRLGKALGHTGLQLSLLAVIAAYGFWRLLPLVRRGELRWIVPFSAVGGFTSVLAESYYRTATWDLVFGGKSYFLIALLKAAGTAVLFFAALVLASRLRLEAAQGEGRPGRGRAKTFGLALLVILLCWLPYIVALYPASVVVDASDQVAQVMGAREFCWTSQHVVASPTGTLLNNHHPVFHTLLIGACVKAGGLVGSYNLGLFLYAGLQSLALAATLAAQVVLLRGLCAGRAFPLCVLVFFAVCPLFPMWGMTVDKDIYFAILTWWVAAGLYMLIRRETVGVGHLLAWGVALLLWMLARNGGLFVIAACAPVIVWALWHRKRLLARVAATTACVGVVYLVGIQTLLFGSMGIASSGSQEMMSVPFMQTARLVRDHPESLSDEDREVLMALFGGKERNLDKMVRAYDKQPTRSDGVKFLFDNEASGRLGDYIRVWRHGLAKHPATYLQALMCLDYGWIYPDNHESVYAYASIAKADTLAQMLPGVHEPQVLQPARRLAEAVVSCCAKLPLVGILFEFANYTWIYFAALVLMIRRGKAIEIAAMSIYFFNYAILFLGPVACLRYALPAIMAVPTLVALTILKAGGSEPQGDEEWGAA